MSQKQLNVRIKHKSDTSANWALATNFTPLKGEIIFYTDLNKIKIGDGSTKVTDLPFLETGGAAPSQYLKSVAIDGNNLTFVKQDDASVTYTPTEQYTGTVTSVSADTGLTISGTSTIDPKVGIASGYKLPTTSEWSGKQDTISDLASIRSGAAAGATAYQKPADGIPASDIASGVIPDSLSDLSDDSTHRLVTDAEKTTWSGKQDALAAQTAYTSQGTATKVPQITTNSLGQVTNITEVTIDQPTVNNAYVSLQVAGTEKTKFYANDSTNRTFNVVASDLGISGALKFIGITTTELTDGSTTNPVTIDGKSVTATSGDVVILSTATTEFLWNGAADTPCWRQLGDTSSYAYKTTTISAGDGLAGGGSLAANRTISHGDTSSQASVTNTGRNYIQSVTLDDYGHVTGLTTGTETVTDTNTWRKVQLNGTDKLSNDVTSNPLNLVPGTNMSITENSGAFTFTAVMDDAMSTTSTNGVQNKVVNAAITALSTDLDTPVDLSSYSKGDVIPDATVAKLKQHATHVKVLYDGRYYHIAQTISEASGLDGLVFISLDASGEVDAVQTLVILKSVGAANYKLADVGSVDVAAYDTNGLLTIKLDDNEKFRVVSTTDELKINFIKNSAQTADINLTFPSVNGTLATVDDATVTSAKVINALGYTPYNSTNPAGYISGITSSDVTTALGYTPYNSTNPAGYISGITGTDVTTALGYTPYNATNPEGYISGIDSEDVINALGYTPLETITSAQVTTALGYVPYNGTTNPNNYISGITGAQVKTALGYTPYNASNPDGYITGITGTDVTTALGYIPYNSTNPNGYISGISSSDVTTALGYTPYNATNPDNYITANATNLTNYYTKTTVDGMVANRFQAKIVTALPTSGISTSTIYMIADATVEDSYDEYMYIEETWVKIGSTSIDMTAYAQKSELHNVAFTGAYTSLVGRPTIPTTTSDLTNDSGYITNSVSNLTNYTKTTDLATVAISGSYNDLLSKPTIPTATSQLTNDSNYVTTSGLSSVNISTFVNDVPYATLNQIQGLEDIDVEEIKKAIAAMEHIGTVTQVTAGTGLSGGGNTTVTLNHSNSVTAVTAWPSGTSAPENGGTFNVRDVKYDTEGHVTNYQDRTITLPYIAPYDDTTVKALISAETSARELTDARVTSLEDYRADQFSAFVFCIFGIEQYIDPSTLQPVADRYYQRSDVDTGIFMDSEKIDIHLKAWLKYHYGLDTQERLKNVTCYVYAMGDHGVYVNHMVTYWSQMTNSQISSYPNLLQTGCFIDDGYGSVHRFSTTEVGALLSSSDDGYIAADPLGTGKGYVSGWNTLTGRVTDLEDTIGDINTVLDTINGEVV